MKLSAILAPLIAAKADHATIMDVVRAFESEQAGTAETSKEKARARWHKWNDKRLQTLANVSGLLMRADDAPDLENKQTNKEERKQDSAPVARGVELAEFKALLSPILDDERIEALVAVRRKKGATFSALAGRGLVKALRSCPDIAAAADEMVLRNWTTVKPDWLESRNTQQTHGPPRGKRMNAVEALVSLRADENGHSSGTRNHGNVELLPPDKPGLPRPVVDLGQTLRWPAGSSDH